MLKLAAWIFVVPLLLVVWSQPGMAQEGTGALPEFGGPDSVPDQTARDAAKKETLTGLSLLEGYFDWKALLHEENGLSYTLDYTMGIMAATRTIDDEDY